MDEHEYQNGATPGPEQTPDHPPRPSHKAMASPGAVPAELVCIRDRVRAGPLAR